MKTLNLCKAVRTHWIPITINTRIAKSVHHGIVSLYIKSFLDEFLLGCKFVACMSMVMDLQFNFLAFEIRWRLQCWANHYYFLHTIFTTGWVLLSCQLKGPWSPPMMNGRFASVCYSWPVACHGQAVWGCISDQAIQPSLVSWVAIFWDQLAFWHIKAWTKLLPFFSHFQIWKWLKNGSNFVLDEFSQANICVLRFRFEQSFFPHGSIDIKSALAQLKIC